MVQQQSQRATPRRGTATITNGDKWVTSRHASTRTKHTMRRAPLAALLLVPLLVVLLPCVAGGALQPVSSTDEDLALILLAGGTVTSLPHEPVGDTPAQGPPSVDNTSTQDMSARGAEVCAPPLSPAPDCARRMLPLVAASAQVPESPSPPSSSSSDVGTPSVATESLLSLTVALAVVCVCGWNARSWGQSAAALSDTSQLLKRSGRISAVEEQLALMARLGSVVEALTPHASALNLPYLTELAAAVASVNEALQHT